MSKIKIGLAGWYERAGLYPSWCRSPVDKLKFYAQEFPIAEVDSSYYAIPAPDVTKGWVHNSPDGFVFNVKAFRLFTAHHTEPQALPPYVRRELPPDLPNRQYINYWDVPPSLRDRLWEDFTKMLEPFACSGKLGIVLFQYAPWFRPFRESFDHILECKGRLPDYRIAVEFRNRWWLHPDYLETISKSEPQMH